MKPHEDRHRRDGITISRDFVLQYEPTRTSERIAPQSSFNSVGGLKTCINCDDYATYWMKSLHKVQYTSDHIL